MKTYKVKVNGKVFEVELEAVSETKGSVAPAAPKQEAAPAPVSGNGSIVAPIAGKVVGVKVNVGDTIKKGDVVAVIEAMKLENEVPATMGGKVVAINVKVGDVVENKTPLITLG